MKKYFLLALLTLSTSAFAQKDFEQTKGVLIFNMSEKNPITIDYEVCAISYQMDHSTTCSETVTTIPNHSKGKNYLHIKPTQELESGYYINIKSATEKDETGKIIAQAIYEKDECGFDALGKEYLQKAAIMLNDMHESPHIFCVKGRV